MDDPGVRLSVEASDLSFRRNVQTSSGAQPASYSTRNRVLSRKKSVRGVMLTTHFHLAPRLRMGGAIPLLPEYAFMAWTGTTSTCNLTGLWKDAIMYDTTVGLFPQSLQLLVHITLGCLD